MKHIRCSISQVNADGNSESTRTCVYSTDLSTEAWLDTIRSAFSLKSGSEICFLTPDGDVFPGLVSALNEHPANPAALGKLGMFDDAQDLVRFCVRVTKGSKIAARKTKGKASKRRVFTYHRMAKEYMAFLLPRDEFFLYFGVRDKRLSPARTSINSVSPMPKSCLRRVIPFAVGCTEKRLLHALLDYIDKVIVLEYNKNHRNHGDRRIELGEIKAFLQRHVVVSF